MDSIVEVQWTLFPNWIVVDGHHVLIGPFTHVSTQLRGVQGDY